MANSLLIEMASKIGNIEARNINNRGNYSDDLAELVTSYKMDSRVNELNDDECARAQYAIAWLNELISENNPSSFGEKKQLSSKCINGY